MIDFIGVSALKQLYHWIRRSGKQNKNVAMVGYHWIRREIPYSDEGTFSVLAQSSKLTIGGRQGGVKGVNSSFLEDDIIAIGVAVKFYKKMRAYFLS